jgi:hypothetical protein
VCRGAVRLALASGLCLSGLWTHGRLRETALPCAVAVQALPPPDLADGRHRLRLQQADLATWFLALYLLTQQKNGLGCFRGIAAVGTEHQPIVTGSGPASVETPELRLDNTIIGNVKNAYMAPIITSTANICRAT